MRCGDCKFYYERAEDGKSMEECRRFPPAHRDFVTAHLGDLLNDIAWQVRAISKDTEEVHQFSALNQEALEVIEERWPYADEDDWCGEFQPK